MKCDEHKAQHLLMACEGALPNEDDAWGQVAPTPMMRRQPAVLYCLRLVLSGDQQEAIWAAKRTYEVADNFVITHTDHN